MDDTELVEGLVLDQKAHGGSGPTRVEKAKIGLIQFCISPPKTDVSLQDPPICYHQLDSECFSQMDNQVVVSDYAAMDRVLREERAYILNVVKQVKAAGCNVLLVQKSILRDAVSDLALHFLDKMKIMVVKDIEREDIEFVCKVSICRCNKINLINNSCPTDSELPSYRQSGSLPARVPGAGRSGRISAHGKQWQSRQGNSASNAIDYAVYCGWTS